MIKRLQDAEFVIHAYDVRYTVRESPARQWWPFRFTINGKCFGRNEFENERAAIILKQVKTGRDSRSLAYVIHLIELDTMEGVYG